MKTNFKNPTGSYKNYYHNRLSKDKHGLLESDNTLNKYNNRPAQAISFSGLNISKVSPNKMAQKFNGIVSWMNKNETAYTAIFTLFVAGMLKPYAIIKQKGGDKKDKQYIATKNFLNAFIGSVLTWTVSNNLFSKAVNKIKNNLKLLKDVEGQEKLELVKADSNEALELAKDILEEQAGSLKSKFSRGKEALKQADSSKFSAFIKGFKSEAPIIEAGQIKEKAKEIVKNAEADLEIFNKDPVFIKKVLKGAKGAYESFWKNVAGAPVAISKAKISSILLPIVVAKFFVERLDKDKQEKKEAKQDASATLISNTFKKDAQNFKPFNQTKPSFTGDLTNSAINSLTHGIEKMSVTKPGENCVNVLNKFKKPSARMGDLESFMLTAYWFINTERSKKIPPSQKFGLNLNNIMVTVTACIASLAIDAATDGIINKAVKSYKKNIEEIYKKIANALKEQPQAKTKDVIEELAEQTKNLYANKNVINSLLNKDIANALRTGKELPLDVKGIDNIIKEADLEKAIKNLSKTYEKKLTKFKSLTLFSLVVRFLVPVLMVPISGKVKKAIMNKKEAEKKQDTTAKK